MQPVKPVEPKVIQLSPEEKGRQLTETGERALAWQQRQSERLGDFVASKMTATPEEIKKTLDNTPAWQVHLAHALFSPGTKYDETQYRREAQAGLELEQKLVGWADKKVVEFFTDPVNVAFMVMTGGTEPLLKVGIRRHLYNVDGQRSLSRVSCRLPVRQGCQLGCLCPCRSRRAP